MKFYLISDDRDALTGMHLAGIPGEYVASPEEARAAIKKAVQDEQIGILLVTQSIAVSCAETVSAIKIDRKTPLLVEIPDSNDSEHPNDNIMKIVHEAIGM